jgi:large subunit ribosomal protein L19
MSDVIPTLASIEKKQLRKVAHPDFRVGDTIKVNVLIREGEKERVQAFEGVVIRRTRGGARASFTVRKVSYGVGVERVFPVNSPRIEKIEVVARGRVRRGRLFYLRDLAGKAARIKEKAGIPASIIAPSVPQDQTPPQ